MLDVDNTLLPWRTEQIPQETLDWITEAKVRGFKLVILSNTRKKARLARLSEALGIPFVTARFKPSRQMYRRALEEHDMPPEQAVMIGDQIFTDVFGANRAGIDAIWVQSSSAKDFIGTRLISRNLEKVIRLLLHRHLIDSSTADAARSGFFQRNVVRQFMRFCFVGGIAFTVDYSIIMTLLYGLQWQGQELGQAVGSILLNRAPGAFGFADNAVQAATPVFRIVSAGTAMMVSFMLNRRFTFGIRGSEQRGTQLTKFLLISITGVLLNSLLTTLFAVVLGSEDKASMRLPVILAAGLVAFWNFGGQKLWAFRRKT